MDVRRISITTEPSASTRVDRSGLETANARQPSCTPYKRDLSSGAAPASFGCATVCQRQRQRIRHRPVQTPPRAVSVASYEPGRASQRAPAKTESSAADCIFRSEEHTSELQSQSNLVCRLLLEKKKTTVARPVAQTEVAAL